MISERRLVVLVGPTYSGKSTAARAFRSCGFLVVSARQALTLLVPRDETVTRDSLIRIGTATERRTRGAWLANVVARTVGRRRKILVDSARTRAQLVRLREFADRGNWRFEVVFVTANAKERRRRFELAHDSKGQRRFETSDWERLSSQTIDMKLVKLRKVADRVMNTTSCSPGDLRRIVRRICAEGT